MTDTYFDGATAQPPHPAARDAYAAALSEGWAGPGRLYTLGRRSRMLLEAARQSAAASLGVTPDEVTFTSSGTQAVHAGVLGVIAARSRPGPLVHSAVEHSSVLHAAEWHERSGGTAISVPVDRLGRVDADPLAGIEDASVLVVQSANHEVGTRQPIAQIAANADGVPLVCDAAASLPWEPVPEGWSVLAASARKWGGLAGAGILVVRKGTRWRNPFPGEDSSIREAIGEVDVPAAVAAAASLRAVVAEREELSKRVRAMTERIRDHIAETVPEVELPGDPVDRLPNIVTFSCLGVDGEVLLTELNRAGFAVSSGSACASTRLRPSHVLQAMGVLSHGNVRVSLHRETTEDEVDRFLEVLPGIVEGIRRLSR
ncbi:MULTISPECIES: cysteine desulfurase family protein [Glycomyces]|uniref:Aminotransferase class V-fold PLP-dependent enzyme n=2 Tax=Glycomyces TaxID=58113 RepID=A0A9X3PLC2_9ACTN|nr:aminotransferase class V-fold PLP-dependent enzyme [Glycomyces lechevalierae]MDA1385042.1 aminotransferase class V-fold PLP-dependent enzyme [Glycomyces lechevalierae]MDR7337507.1 cysteine desulfurase [Glycomyces lechevalierae]